MALETFMLNTITGYYLHISVMILSRLFRLINILKPEEITTIYTLGAHVGTNKCSEYKTLPMISNRALALLGVAYETISHRSSVLYQNLEAPF